MLGKNYIIKNKTKKKQLERLHNTLNNGIKIFNSTQKSKNYILTKEEQNFMEAEILNISGNTQTQKHFYIKFILDGCKDGPIQSIVREAKKRDTIIHFVPKVLYTETHFY